MAEEQTKPQPSVPSEYKNPDAVPIQKADAKTGQKPAKADLKKLEQKKVSDVLQSVHIALDTYDDIFSDFDPSPYETRLLSDDFLNELHKRYMETPKGVFAITFTLPKAFRSEKKESLIRKRIKDYFKRRLKDLDKSTKDRNQRGALRVGIGVILSMVVLIFPSFEQALVAALISPLLWYLMWSGFESLFEASSKLRKRKHFLEKFLKADYNFKDQESVVVEVVQYSSSSYR